jgi:hypothetical protein
MEARLVELPACGPYPDAATHLADHLVRVELCLRRRATPIEDRGPIHDEIAALDEGIAARLACGGADAPSLHRGLGAAIAALRGDQPEQPDAGFLIDLLALDPGWEAELCAELAEQAPLRRFRLLKLAQARGWSPEGPLFARPAAVPERVVDWMKGAVAFDRDRYGVVAQARAGGAGGPDLDGARLARALFREHDGRRLPLLVQGPSSSGKASALAAAAERRGLATLEVDLEAVALSERPVELLHDLVREARLQEALLVLRRGDLLGDGKPELRAAVQAALSDGGVWCALTSRAAPPEVLRRLPGAHLVHQALPPRTEQLRLWQLALPADVERAADLDPAEVVQRYNLTPGDILEAGAQACARAELSGAGRAVSLDDVVTAVRGRLSHRLGEVAELVTTSLGWDDLVLRDELLDRIEEMVSAVRWKAQVMDGWGFARKVTYGRALSALFSGPPGTGKTMVATLVAKELGLELFRVDLSRVVSKWVGETEKNLGRAFEEAERSQAILLFDEADALFARRTDVKSSNDRYANLEVNYLLQRLESFEGIVLLTTNNATSIDDAFRRRLRFRIDFAAPDADEREALWRAMLPDSAPLADDLDLRALAEGFAMAGGYIKNAVVRAAYLAAASPERVISQRTLLRAATLEWEDMGNLTVHADH